MDELFEAVRLHRHLLTVPLHLVELLLYAVQRQAFGLTAQRSCSSCYRRSLSFCLNCSSCFVSGCFVFVLFVTLFVSGCQLAPYVLGLFCPLSVS